MSLITQPAYTTAPYSSLVITFGSVAWLVFSIEGPVIGGLIAFIFAVIFVPAGFLEVH